VNGGAFETPNATESGVFCARSACRSVTADSCPVPCPRSGRRSETAAHVAERRIRSVPGAAVHRTQMLSPDARGGPPRKARKEKRSPTLQLSLVSGPTAPDQAISHPPGRFGAAMAGPSGACRSSVVHVCTVNCLAPAPAQTTSSARRRRHPRLPPTTCSRHGPSTDIAIPCIAATRLIFTPRAERLHARGNLGNEGVFRRAHQHFKGGVTLDVISQEPKGSARRFDGDRSRSHRAGRGQRCDRHRHR
jgi:hypothetical protein